VRGSGSRKPSLCWNGWQLEAKDDGEDPLSGWLPQLLLPEITDRQENAVHLALQRARKWPRLSGSAGPHEKRRRPKPSLFLRCLLACHDKFCNLSPSAESTMSERSLTMSTPRHARELTTEDLPVEERIRERAYDLYVQHGGQSGSELEDWLQAETEIREIGPSEH
jgi:hypothetical protein